MSLEFIIIIVVTSGWDNLVGIAVCYVVGSPMLRPQVWARFSGPMHKFPEEHPVSYTMGADLLAGAWRLPCTVDVEYKYNYISTFPLCLLGV